MTCMHLLIHVLPTPAFGFRFACEEKHVLCEHFIYSLNLNTNVGMCSSSIHDLVS